MVREESTTKTICNTNKKRLSAILRIVTVLLVLSMVLGFAACGRSGKNTSEDETSASEPAGEPSPSPSPSPTPEPPQTTIATVNDIDGPLNIRNKPSTEDSEVIGSANSGDKFEVLTEYCDEERAWHEIAYADGEGGKAYVSAEFTTISKGTLPGTTGSDPENPVAAATPNSERPIIVNGSGREDTSKEENDPTGVTPETIKQEEDPGQR